MEIDEIEFHNIAEAREVDGYDGQLLQRVPEEVRVELNQQSQDRMLRPASAELRFVPDGPVEVTLSAPDDGNTVQVFWGPFQGWQTVELTSEPTTLQIKFPERLEGLSESVAIDTPFDPRVCRLVVSGGHDGSRVHYHGVSGERRPPRAEELPETRYLAYGTSITEGVNPTAEHLTYVNRTSRRLGADAINLGSGGSAYCDATMAEYIASRADWDIASFALSVNMVYEFSVEEFEKRARYFVETVADSNPDAPIACITLYPYIDDLCTCDTEGMEPGRASAFREALCDVVATAPPNVYLLHGPDLLDDPTGLLPDLLHPGDFGMQRIAERLAIELDTLQ